MKQYQKIYREPLHRSHRYIVADWTTDACASLVAGTAWQAVEAVPGAGGEREAGAYDQLVEKALGKTKYGRQVMT